MSRPDDGAGSDLDALLASPTPTPDGAEAEVDGSADADGPAERGSTPVRGRLEAWLRGGRSESGAPGEERVAEVSDGVGESDIGVPPPVVSPAAALSGEAGGEDAGDDGSGATLGALRSVPVDSIEPNRFQPRRRFDEDALGALADSIRELGVLQPVLVRPLGDDRYELVAGERRWRASQRAGLGMIPVLIRESGDLGALEQAIVENLHRQDLSPLEEATAYQELIADFGLTQEQVARRVGKSRSSVTNTLRLLQLPIPVQRLVGDGLLSAGHARALLSLADPEAQRELADRVVDEELSVRQTEEMARQMGEGQAERAGSSGGARKAERSAAALEVEELLGDHLETQVEVQGSGRGGRLVIRYADEEDLDRVVRLLLSDGNPGS